MICRALYPETCTTKELILAEDLPTYTMTNNGKITSWIRWDIGAKRQIENEHEERENSRSDEEAQESDSGCT